MRTRRHGIHLLFRASQPARSTFIPGRMRNNPVRFINIIRPLRPLQAHQWPPALPAFAAGEDIINRTPIIHQVIPMEKGHIELGEVLFIALLVIGLATAIIILTDANGNSHTVLPGANNSSDDIAPPDSSFETNGAKDNASSSVAQEAEPLIVTNKSIGTLIEEGLLRADSWFYSTSPQGNFDVDTYGWAMGLANMSPDSIPIKTNDLRAVEVRFGGRYDDALRAFTFRHYTSPTVSEPARIYAIAIFISNSTLIDAANQTFNINYDPYPGGPQILEGCLARNSSSLMTSGGSHLKVYDITCKIMYGVYP